MDAEAGGNRGGAVILVRFKLGNWERLTRSLEVEQQEVNLPCILAGQPVHVLGCRAARRSEVAVEVNHHWLAPEHTRSADGRAGYRGRDYSAMTALSFLVEPSTKVISKSGAGFPLSAAAMLVVQVGRDTGKTVWQSEKRSGKRSILP